MFVFSEGFAINKFSGNKMGVIRFADVVNRNDVLDDSERKRTLLREQTGSCGRHLRQTQRANLEGDFSIKLGVLSEKHLTHPAFADGREDLILIKN